jgi:hypothetical protein
MYGILKFYDLVIHPVENNKEEVLSGKEIF